MLLKHIFLALLLWRSAPGPQQLGADSGGSMNRGPQFLD